MYGYGRAGYAGRGFGGGMGRGMGFGAGTGRGRGPCGMGLGRGARFGSSYGASYGARYGARYGAGYGAGFGLGRGPCGMGLGRGWGGVFPVEDAATPPATADRSVMEYRLAALEREAASIREFLDKSRPEAHALRHETDHTC